MIIKKEEPDLKQIDSKKELSSEITVSKEKLDVVQSETEKMIAAGLHFGHRKNKKHPKMQPYIHGVRNGIKIIDVKKTEEKLEEALKIISFTMKGYINL